MNKQKHGMGADRFKERTLGINTFPIDTFKVKSSDALQILLIKVSQDSHLNYSTETSAQLY